MKTSEILERAKARIIKPGSWIQGTAARDKEGQSVGSQWEGACSFCTLGALWAEQAENTYRSSAETLLERAATNHGYRSVIEFNDKDGRTHEEVLAFYDRVIAKAKEYEDVSKRSAGGSQSADRTAG